MANQEAFRESEEEIIFGTESAADPEWMAPESSETEQVRERAVLQFAQTVLQTVFEDQRVSYAETELWRRSDLPCRGETSLFFRGYGESKADWEERSVLPKSLCAGCVVRLTCFEYADRNREQCGVWGGVDFEPK